MKNLIVLVLEGEYRLTAAVLFCLHQQPGLQVHMVSREEASPFRYSRYLRSHHHQEQPAFRADFVPFVALVAGRTGAQVLLPVDVEGMRFAIAHRAALEGVLRVVPLPSAGAYEIAADKSRLAVFMEAHGLPGPRTLSDLGRGLPARLAALRFPVLLKPTDGAGGRGIRRYEAAPALLAAVAALPTGASYLVQTYLEGYDIDCNVLYANGQLLAHSIQRGLVAAADPYAPAEAIEFVHNAAVLAVADALMTALGWNGVAHLDLRYDAATGQVNVIEINPRFWLTVVGSALAAGVNFPALACRAALGQTPALAPAPAPATPGRYIPLMSFLRHRYAARRPRHPAAFAWADTSLAAFGGDPLPKLICLLNPRQVRME